MTPKAGPPPIAPLELVLRASGANVEFALKDGGGQPRFEPARSPDDDLEAQVRELSGAGSSIANRGLGSLLADRLPEGIRRALETRFSSDAASPATFALDLSPEHPWSDLPWEALHVGTRGVAKRGQSAFVRRVPRRNSPWPIRARHGLRVLVLVGDVDQVSNAPSGTHALAEQVNSVLEQIGTTLPTVVDVAAHESFDASHVHHRRVERFADKHELIQRLGQHYDIVHFIGKSAEEPREESLTGRRTTGLSFRGAGVLTTAEIVDALAAAPPALLVLAACSVQHAFAHALGASAEHIIGHAYQVEPESASRWTAAFYAALFARDGSVQGAVAAARGTLGDDAGLLRHFASDTRPQPLFDAAAHARATYAALVARRPVVRDREGDEDVFRDQLHVELVTERENVAESEHVERLRSKLADHVLEGRPRSRKFVLRGDAGSGKSTTARHFVRELVTQQSDDDTPWLPVFIEAKRWNSDERSCGACSFAEAFRASVSEFTDFESLFAAFNLSLATDRVVVVLDGLDEVPSDVGTAIVAHLEVLLGTDRGRLLVTTRRTRIGEQLAVGWTSLKLAELTPSQQDDIVAKWCEEQNRQLDARRDDRPRLDSTGEAAQFFAHLPRSHETARSPLLLSIAARMWTEDCVDGRTPDSVEVLRSRARLMDRAVEKLVERRTHSDDVEATIRSLEDLALVATILHGSAPLRAGARLATGAAGRVTEFGVDLAALGKDRTALAHVQELAESGVLRRTGDAFEFVHNAYREALAARALARSLGTACTDLKAVQTFLNRECGTTPIGAAWSDNFDERWAEPLAMLSWHIAPEAHAAWMDYLAPQRRVRWRTILAGGIKDPWSLVAAFTLDSTRNFGERREVYRRILSGDFVDDPSSIVSSIERLLDYLLPLVGASEPGLSLSDRPLRDMAYIDFLLGELAHYNTDHAADVSELRIRLIDRVPTFSVSSAEAPFATTPLVGLCGLPHESIEWLAEIVPLGERRSFTLGSPQNEHDRGSDEGPHHGTEVGPFWIARVPVTVAQYELFDVDYRSPCEGGRKPATAIDWFEAQFFCRWLTHLVRTSPKHFQRLPPAVSERICTGQLLFRAPKEAEWEYAARNCNSEGATWEGPFGRTTVGDREVWAGSEGGPARPVRSIEVGDIAVYHANRPGSCPAEVGTKLPTTPHRLFDMHGNVSEWCIDAEAPYESVAADRVVAGDVLDWRVLRGGGCRSDAHELRSAYRFVGDPNHGDDLTGFRVVLAPPLLRHERHAVDIYAP
jgi:formylglycine-generating enzyme required for sulfatase activity